MRAALALAGFGLAVGGAGLALLLHDAGIDDAGGWMLAVAGLALGSVAPQWGSR